MKKIMIIALAVLAGASFNSVDAKKKVVKKQLEDKPVVIVTESDSVSYAAGMASTRGLEQYVIHEFNVDSAYANTFIEGFKAALLQMDDANYRAYIAGTQVAWQAYKGILPSTAEQFHGTRDSINGQLFYAGFMDAVRKSYQVFEQAEAQNYFESHMKSAQQERDEAIRKKNADWLEENKTKPNVITTESGLQYKVITMGTGEVPQKTDEVTVKYEGKLIDGTIFDSSYERTPQTSDFRPNQVIKGWTEALTMMPVGSKWELYIPQELGYGERQAGKIPPYSTLIFTVELVSINKK